MHNVSGSRIPHAAKNISLRVRTHFGPLRPSFEFSREGKTSRVADKPVPAGPSPGRDRTSRQRHVEHHQNRSSRKGNSDGAAGRTAYFTATIMPFRAPVNAPQCRPARLVPPLLIAWRQVPVCAPRAFPGAASFATQRGAPPSTFPVLATSHSHPQQHRRDSSVAQAGVRVCTPTAPNPNAELLSHQWRTDPPRPSVPPN